MLYRCTQGPAYFIQREADVEICQTKGCERGERGSIGPFIKIGNQYFTKSQATELAKLINDQITRMD